MALYPANTFQEATEIAIEASNQLHGVINGDANAEVTVEDGSKIPSVRKAMVDSLYFKPPIAWAQGEYEDTYNQLREFVDGDVRTWWFAKGATVSTPVLMSTNPHTDQNWSLWDAVTVKRYTCVADMVSDVSLSVGQIVETLGYYDDWVGTNDKPKGGNRYEIVVAGTGTADGGSFITLSNGLQAKGLFLDGMVNISQFGVKGDGLTDDTYTLTNALKMPLVEAWPEAIILTSKTYDDGTDPARGYFSYAINPLNSCTLDLKGGTILRGKLGEGDAIDMYKTFIINTPIKFRIKNGTIDMNNHNGRFILFSGCLQGSGLYHCNIINTSNNGTPRTILPSSCELVGIADCTSVYVQDCKFYVGSDGDLSGDTPASYDNPSFGIRVVSKFVTIEENQNQTTVGCGVDKCEFYGRFTWQPVEIAGTGTTDCFFTNSIIHRPLLSAIDLDKGCKRCYAENITIRFPEPGFVPFAGGDGYEIIRFQGYTDGVDSVYAEDCWVNNVSIYSEYYNITIPSGNALRGHLIYNNQAVNCTAKNISMSGPGVVKELFHADADSNLKIINCSATCCYVSRSNEPHAEIFNCNIDILFYAFSLSPVYLYSSNVDITVSGGNYKKVGDVAGSFWNSYEQTLQPKVLVSGVNAYGFYKFINATGTTKMSNIRFIGNNSIQVASDTLSTIDMSYISGNNSLLI